MHPCAVRSFADPVSTTGAVGVGCIGVGAGCAAGGGTGSGSGSSPANAGGAATADTASASVARVMAGRNIEYLLEAGSCCTSDRRAARPLAIAMARQLSRQE